MNYKALILGLIISAILLIIFGFAPAEAKVPPAARLSPEACRNAINDYEERRDTMTRDRMPDFIARNLGFDFGECTNFAMRQREDLQVLNLYKEKCTSNTEWWNGGVWPEMINKQVSGTLTLQQAFRQDTGREWYWLVDQNPEPGATAHWKGCEYKSAQIPRAVLPNHVAYVVNSTDTTLEILQDNIPSGSQSGTNNQTETVTRTNCIVYIHPVDKRDPVPPVVREQTAEARFSIRWPLRWISVTTPYRFELRFDSNPAVVLSSGGGTNRTFEGKVFLMPGSHTAKLRYWAEAGAPAPQFKQSPFVFGQVLAAEPDDGTPLPIEYSLIATPSTAQAGDRVTLAYSAREPVSHYPIAAIELYVNDRLVNRANGARGTYIWQTASGDAGRARIRLQARLDGFDAVQNKEYLYTVQAKDIPPPPASTRPDAPILATPGNGSSWHTNAEITLRWNSSANATQYKVELWGGPYSTMTPCDWQSDTTCRIGAMRVGAMSWHVKARNASGESDWSGTWSFTIQEPPRIITITPTWTPTPTATPTLTPVASSDGDLQIVGSLSLSTTSPRVGDSVTASFRIRNTSSRAIIIRQLEAGARGPNARSLNWNAPEVDFPAVFALTLQPGQELHYRQSRTFDAPGDYFAEPVWMDAFGAWAGVQPYPRVWFNVGSKPIATVAPPARPNRPTLSSPGNQEFLSNRTEVTLVWNSVANATQYRVETWGSNNRTCEWQNGTSCRITGLGTGSMAWHVKARNASGAESDWSDTWTFVIRPPEPPPSPGRLVLVQGLAISPSNPTHGQNVNAKYRVKNDGGAPITVRFFGVKGRLGSLSYDFHWIENKTFQPGEEFLYDVNRPLDRAGTYSFTPNFSLDGANWADLKFANGSTSYVTISVR